MLTRTLAKRFSAGVYTWGWNYNNLGRVHGQNQPTGEVVPTKLNLQGDRQVQKIVMGFSESVVLNQDGTYFNFGTRHVFPSATEEPMLSDDIGQAVRDVDLDYSHAIFLTTEGMILEQDSKGITSPSVQGNVHSVACGNGFSLAVMGEEYGNQRVMAWPTNKSCHPSVFCRDQLPNGPVEIAGLTQLIQADNTRIKRLKVVDNSVAVLLENGVLAVWGNNRTGNLAIPRSLTILHDVYIKDVKVPMVVNKIKDYVKDFDISSNNMIILTEKGNLYYSGRDKDLKLEKLPFFNDKKVASVGSFHNNYVIVTDHGEVFTTEAPKDEFIVKYWGDYKLYQVDQEYFNNSKVLRVSGKYDNAFALTA